MRASPSGHNGPTHTTVQRMTNQPPGFDHSATCAPAAAPSCGLQPDSRSLAGPWGSVLETVLAEGENVRAWLQVDLDESWREGDHTVAFALPESDVQIMVSIDTDPPGPMYIVDDAAAWVAAHPELTPLSDVSEIPDGAVVRYADPAGNAFYVFDQAGAA